MAHQPIRGPGSGLKFLNHPFGVTTYTKVFVGGLAWETKSETLHSYFEHFGEILEAFVITDKHTGRSKGYGFVTFRDPEAAVKACADLHPLIDGRKANCSFASHGRPQLPLPYGRVTSAVPYLGGPQTPRGPYAGSPSYFQPVSYSYRSGFPYSPYGYSAYGPEYIHPQRFYSSYLGQHQPQMYGVPGAVNTNAFSGQSGLPGNLGYRPIQGFVMPGPRLVQYSRPNFRGALLEIIPTIQAPYLTGMALSLGQATPAQFPQGGSD